VTGASKKTSNPSYNIIPSTRQPIFHLSGDYSINNHDNLSQNYNQHVRNLVLLSELLTLQQQQQQQKNQSVISNKEKEQLERKIRSQSKRILLVDDNRDITLTFKQALEAENEKSGNKTYFKVDTYNDTILALAEFKPNFYDLLLIDVNIPKMNGFEFSRQILELDVNVRVCYITAAEINLQALREQFPTLSIGCYIKKPIGVEDLVRRVRAELD
jgi:CheY-like chemotaxis protein